VSKVRFILVALICESPAILLWDGPITRALVTGAVAAAMLITVRALRPDETKFFVSILPPLAITAVPALWIIIQVLPLRALAHPMWKSAETALGRPLADTISIDLGASVLALGQYLSMIAVIFVAAAIAVDRRRAEWLLFALTGACALIGVIVLIDVSFRSNSELPLFVAAPALDCAALGTIIAGAAIIRGIERYETRRSSLTLLLPTFIASSVALMICGLALLLGGTNQVIIAAACGCAALAWIKMIRRFVPSSGLSFALVTVLILIAAIFLTIFRPIERGQTLLLAFATSSSVTTAASERMLADAPLVGTGAGTFAALLPIYRETIDDSQAGPVDASTAATLAIELGEPMFWLIVAVAVASIVFFFRASLRRGRDSYYATMGVGCLVTLLLLAFNNGGLLETATGLIAAVALGLALAQSKSRIVE
jgi:hypothetical protein